MGGLAISKARRLSGMIAARFLVLPKTKPREVGQPAGFYAVTISGSGESIKRDSSAHLDPCTAWLVRPALGAVHDFTPVAARLGPAGVGHQSENPRKWPQRTRKAVTWAGGSNTLNTATVGGCSSHRPCWLHTPARPARTTGKAPNPASAG